MKNRHNWPRFFLTVGLCTTVCWAAAVAEGVLPPAIPQSSAPAARPAPKQPVQANPKSASIPSNDREIVARAWKTFTDAEAGKNPEKRSAALLALGNAGDRADVIQMLTHAMDDPHPPVRRAAAAAIGMARARTMIPRLEKALDDPAPAVRVAAARSLWQMKDYAGSALFERILTHQERAAEGGVRGEWHEAMGKASDPEYLFVLGLHEGAGTLLGPYALVFPLYRYLSTDRAAPARAAIAALLGDRHTDAAVAALEMALIDKSALVRAAAAISLGKSERPQEIGQLAPLLHDRKYVVRLSAAAAIVRLSPAGSEHR